MINRSGPGVLRRSVLPELPEDMQEWHETAGKTNLMADLAGYPEEYIVCPICAQHSWRLPPHGFTPCPLAITAAESQSLKTDAERNTAIRMGQQLEAASRWMEKHMGDDDADS